MGYRFYLCIMLLKGRNVNSILVILSFDCVVFKLSLFFISVICSIPERILMAGKVRTFFSS